MHSQQDPGPDVHSPGNQWDKFKVQNKYGKKIRCKNICVIAVKFVF